MQIFSFYANIMMLYRYIVTYMKDPCCLHCYNNTLKYYSIDTSKDLCGESCIYPSWYNFYKLFEPGLAYDNHTSYPCYSYGYTVYNSTVKHGYWPFSLEVDLYEQHSNMVHSILLKDAYITNNEHETIENY